MRTSLGASPNSHKAKHDRYAEKAYAREKGMAEGRAEGLAEGRAEGLTKGIAEGLAKGKAEGLAKGKAEGLAKGISQGISQIAKSMLQANESVAKIMKYTKLSKKEILALK